VYGCNTKQIAAILDRGRGSETSVLRSEPTELTVIASICNQNELRAAYCVAATESAGRQIPMAFLEMIKEDFNKRYAGGKAATATANSLSREFGPRLGAQMQYCRDHPEEVSRLSRVKAQVDQVKGIMMENIDKVIDRGEQIDGLVTRTEQLHNQAADFRQQGTRVRRRMWYQNMKTKLIVLGIVIALILIIILSVYHGIRK